MNLSDQEFKDLCRLIKDLCGIWLGEDKRYLVQSRLEPVLHVNGLSAYAELAARASSPMGMKLQNEVVEAITTKETSFNRDGHPFEEIRKSILPLLIQARLARQIATGLPFGKLRIWSAAASTGQEAYSLGIAILEFIREQPKTAANRFLVGPENFHILGTDISERALRIARLGRYNARDIERGTDNDTKKKYFVERSDEFEVTQNLRNLVEFQCLNLIRPLVDASCFELILCRNLLIYFNESTRGAVLDHMAKRLTSGGILMLGSAENTNSLPAELIQVQCGRTIVYRKV